MMSLCIYLIFAISSLILLVPAVYINLTRIKINDCVVVPCYNNYRESMLLYDKDCIQFIVPGTNITMFNNIAGASRLTNLKYYDDHFTCYTDGDVAYIINQEVFLYISIVICVIIFIIMMYMFVSNYINISDYDDDFYKYSWCWCCKSKNLLDNECICMFRILITIIIPYIVYLIIAIVVDNTGKCYDYNKTQQTITRPPFKNKFYEVMTIKFINNNINNYYPVMLNNIKSDNCMIIGEYVYMYDHVDILIIITYCLSFHIIVVLLYLGRVLLFKYKTQPVYNNLESINMSIVNTESINIEICEGPEI